MHDIASSDITTIAPTRGWTSLGLSEVWRYRELLYFLTWRDIKVRYKQTVVGIAWALIQPLANLVLFTIVFGRLAKLPSDGIPYPLFSLAGLVPWTFFSTALSTVPKSSSPASCARRGSGKAIPAHRSMTGSVKS